MKKYSIELMNIIIIRNQNKKIAHLFRNNKLKKLLYTETNFLDESLGTTERLYYIENNIFTSVLCDVCGKPTIHKYVNKKYIKKSCSTRCSKSKIDPVTGLTGYQTNWIKIRKTMSLIDANNENGYKKSRKKQIVTMSQLDPVTGLTGYQNSANKTKQTLAKIDPKTGISNHKINQLNIRKIMSEVDPISKLNKYEQNSIKTKKTLNRIDETGLTGYQKLVSKIVYSKKIHGFDDIKKALSKDFKLLTTFNEYTGSKHSILKYQCIKCDTIRESYWPYIRCITCHPYNRSIGENEVLEYCKSLGAVPYSNNRSIIPPLELDIYIPDHKLAIEYNGLFWHSSDSTESEKKDYHLYKTQECEKKGIQLFHIFENEWSGLNKQKIWKSIISNKLGHSERIYARKTSVKRVTSKDKSRFLNGNHLQGTCGSSVNLGLYYEGELVSLMTFGKSRYDKKVEWELLRFCNKVGYSVVGGASRLLKAFTVNHEGSIISYADKRRSNGNLYKQLGFELSHESKPNYFYIKNGILESRLKYQKHKLKDKLDNFDSNLTETKNMYNNKFRKIYDCGNQAWILQ